MTGTLSKIDPGLPLVSVIIPAYNAAATLDETLRSVRGQTYDNLDIIIIDDGSKDETAKITQRHARADARVRLITQVNSGVAKARNNGIAQAKGNLIAPIDADDLWHTDKIARQVEAMISGGPKVGLVYNWYVRIDQHGLVKSYSPKVFWEGHVFEEMMTNYLIGNGSTPLMRKDAVLACGGYDPELQAQGAHGCEDHKLYLAISEKYHFAVVPAFLTGYRATPDNMSSDGPRMIRSMALVIDPLYKSTPRLRQTIGNAKFSVMDWYLWRSVREKAMGRALRILLIMLRQFPMRTVHTAFCSPSGFFAWLDRKIRTEDPGVVMPDHLFDRGRPPPGQKFFVPEPGEPALGETIHKASSL